MMKRRSINRWITRCFIIILPLSMIASAVANLREAYVGVMKQDSELVKICAVNVTTLLNRPYTPKAVLEPDQHIYPEAWNALQDVCEAYRLNISPSTASILRRPPGRSTCV